MKQVLIILAVLGVGYWAYSKTTAAPENEILVEGENDIIINSPMPLTSIQAKNYLEDYKDVANVFGANNLEGANTHWMNNGFREGRTVRG